MKNDITKMPFEIVKCKETYDEIIKGKCKTISFSELSAYGLAGNELMNLINNGMKAGGEGIYKVSFPNGIRGTLSKFKNEEAYLGSITGNGTIAQARLTKVSFNPEQAFMAIALIGIELKLGEIVELQTKMLNYLYAEEEAKTIGNMKMLNETIESFKYNRDIPEFVNQKLVLIDSIKSDSQKSIALYKKQIEDTMNTMNGIHFIEDANKKSNEINRFLAGAYGAYYVLTYATFFETYLTNNFQSENLNNIQQCIARYTQQYEDLYLSCENWMIKQINSSINRWAAPFLKMTDAFVEKVVKPLPIGVDKFYNNDSQKYISAEEQIKKIEPYKNLKSMIFCDEITRLNFVHNQKAELFADGKNLYLSFEEKSKGKETKC